MKSVITNLVLLMILSAPMSLTAKETTIEHVIFEGARLLCVERFQNVVSNQQKVGLFGSIPVTALNDERLSAEDRKILFSFDTIDSAKLEKCDAIKKTVEDTWENYGFLRTRLTIASVLTGQSQGCLVYQNTVTVAIAEPGVDEDKVRMTLSATQTNYQCKQ